MEDNNSFIGYNSDGEYNMLRSRKNNGRFFDVAILKSDGTASVGKVAEDNLAAAWTARANPESVGMLPFSNKANFKHSLPQSAVNFIEVSTSSGVSTNGFELTKAEGDFEFFQLNGTPLFCRIKKTTISGNSLVVVYHQTLAADSAAVDTYWATRIAPSGGFVQFQDL